MKAFKITLVVAVLVLGARSSCAEEAGAPAEKITFKRFYEEVLAYYPKLKKQDADVALAIARKLQAVSGFLPRMQGTASVTTGDDPVYVFGTLLKQNSFHDDDFATSRLNTPRPRANYSFALQGEVPIFDALQTASKVRSTALLVEAAKDDDEFVRAEALLVAAEVYLRAAALEKLLLLTGEVSRDSEADIKQAEDLKDRGMILGADYYSARVVFGSVNRLKNDLAREKEAVHILMNILMGREPMGRFELAGTLKEAGELERPLETWFDEALKSRQDLSAIEKAVMAQAAEVRREKFTILPRVSAFGSVEEDTHSLDSNGGQNYMMGFKGTMDLYDPSYPSRIKAAEESLRKLEYDRTILKDSIKKDLADEFARYSSVRDNTPVVRGMYEDGGEAVKLMAPLYREGRKSIADLLEIRLAYLDAARGYYSLLADTEASLAKMYFLSGKLDEERMAETAQRIGD